MIFMIFLEINIVVMCSVLVELIVVVDELFYLDIFKFLINIKFLEYNEFGILWFVFV